MCTSLVDALKRANAIVYSFKKRVLPIMTERQRFDHIRMQELAERSCYEVARSREHLTSLECTFVGSLQSNGSVDSIVMQILILFSNGGHVRVVGKSRECRSKQGMQPLAEYLSHQHGTLHHRSGHCSKISTM